MNSFGAARSDFAANNALLNLTLGALSLRDQLLSLVEQYAPERAQRAAKSSIDSDPAIFLVLGAICLAEHIGARAKEAATAHREEPARAEPRLDPPGSLLR